MAVFLVHILDGTGWNERWIMQSSKQEGLLEPNRVCWSLKWEMESSGPSCRRKLYTYLLCVRYEAARIKLVFEKSLRDNYFRNFAVVLLECSKTKSFAMSAIYALADAC